jgi:hypothetical protein
LRSGPAVRVASPGATRHAELAPAGLAARYRRRSAAHEERPRWTPSSPPADTCRQVSLRARMVPDDGGVPATGSRPLLSAEQCRRCGAAGCRKRRLERWPCGRRDPGPRRSGARRPQRRRGGPEGFCCVAPSVTTPQWRLGSRTGWTAIASGLGKRGKAPPKRSVQARATLRVTSAVAGGRAYFVIVGSALRAVARQLDGTVSPPG